MKFGNIKIDTFATLVGARSILRIVSCTELNSVQGNGCEMPVASHIYLICTSIALVPVLALAFYNFNSRECRSQPV